MTEDTQLLWEHKEERMPPGVGREKEEGVACNRACMMQGVGWRCRVGGREGAVGRRLERRLVPVCQWLGRASNAISNRRSLGPVSGGPAGHSFSYSPTPLLNPLSSSRSLLIMPSLRLGKQLLLQPQSLSPKNLPIFQDSSHAMRFPEFLQHPGTPTSGHS